MEEEVRDILRDALKDEDALAGGLGTEIASLFNGVGLDADIQELRGPLPIPTADPGAG
jgi:plasmid stability protein